MKNLYHPVDLNGVIVYMPSSIPNNLRKFVDVNHLIKDDKMANFKNQVKALK